MKSIISHIVVLLSMVLFTNLVHAQAPEGFTWQAVNPANFGDGVNHFTIKAASYGTGGEVELRLDKPD